MGKYTRRGGGKKGRVGGREVGFPVVELKNMSFLFSQDIDALSENISSLCEDIDSIFRFFWLS